MAIFQDGDVVILKSGDPAMTVTGIDGLQIMCTWFPSEESMPETAVFPEAALLVMEEDEDII